jgi:gamma-glutamylcyclotransferase (GGCT)/AIG2-like uncharacterized protein YtfP
MPLVFVYGTLKRGGSNHSYLVGQTFVANARTPRGFRLYELDGYPGMVASADDQSGVTGEIWSLDDTCLAELDRLEGLSEGLYRRVRIPLLAPFDQREVETYLYARSVAGSKMLGSTWSV